MDERTVNLWEHLPSFLKQFKELDKLLEAETPEFQLMVQNGLKLLNNLFIMTAEDEGLKRFEKILNIYPSDEDTIETRRKNVMVEWYTKDIYTLKSLRNRLEMLQGNDNIQFEWDEDDKHLLHVTTRLDYKGQVDTLAWILENMLPANVAYDSQNYIEMFMNVNLYAPVVMIGTGTFFLTNDFHQTVNGIIPFNIANGSSITENISGQLEIEEIEEISDDETPDEVVIIEPA